MIRTIAIPQITCAGADGAATGTGVSATPIRGTIRGIHLNHSTGAATTDVTVRTTQAPTRTLLVKADSAADAWFYPAVPHNLASDGSALSAWSAPVVDDYITVAVAQANGAQTLDVTLLVEE